MEGHDDDTPLFSAVSSTARQLYLLLRCISFASKTQVQISEEGLRFSVEEASAMEGNLALFPTMKHVIHSM